MKHILSLIIAVFLAIPSFAQTELLENKEFRVLWEEKISKFYPGWVPVNIDSKSRLILINKSSIKTKGKYRPAWIMQDGIENEEHKSSISLWYFDCKNESYQTIQFTTYSKRFLDGGGKVISSVNSKLEENGFEIIAPGTVGKAMLNFVCSYKEQ